jgi:hypothetical protein
MRAGVRLQSLKTGSSEIQNFYSLCRPLRGETRSYT